MPASPASANRASTLYSAMRAFGTFKQFFDLVDQYALVDKPVLLAATGGGDNHALALEHALRRPSGSFPRRLSP